MDGGSGGKKVKMEKKMGKKDTRRKREKRGGTTKIWNEGSGREGEKKGRRKKKKVRG